MIKQLARCIVPQSMRRARYERWMSRRFAELVQEWEGFRGSIHDPVNANRSLTNLLIFPGDPSEVTGSVGDEAMITATIQQARAVNPAVRLHMLVYGDTGAAVARRLGADPVDIWNRSDFLHCLANLLSERQIDATVANGADILDGVYGGLVPARMICAADIAARMGVAATILGSSFNKQPLKELKPLLDQADPRIEFCLRDQMSLDRFVAFTEATPVLVADSAFMLQTPAPDATVANWVAARRSAGELVIGFNLHPMLVKEDSTKVTALVNASVAALGSIASDMPVAWLLVPHDRRDKVGDMLVLQRVYDSLFDKLGDRLALVDAKTQSAAGLKAIAGTLDGVISGRMHLAIASLGKGVPVLCVTYQDKFEGLFAHFELPETMLMSVDGAMEALSLETTLRAFLSQIPELHSVVGRRLNTVMERSRRNYAALWGGA